MRSNRDREGPHGLPPPTPPYVRVTYTAVRQIQSGWHVHPDRSVLSRGASREFLPDAGQYPPSRRRRSRHSTTGRNSSLPFRPSARSARLLCPLLTSAVRSGRIPPPSVLCPRTHCNISRGKSVVPSVHRRLIYNARLTVDGGLCCSVLKLCPEVCHTPYQVRVPRPAHSLHASFRPHLAATPLRFTCPSAPRTPGQGTFTPKHDDMPTEREREGRHGMSRTHTQHSVGDSRHV